MISGRLFAQLPKSGVAVFLGVAAVGGGARRGGFFGAEERV
jgi:hypothetical protein